MGKQLTTRRNPQDIKTAQKCFICFGLERKEITLSSGNSHQGHYTLITARGGKKQTHR